MPTPSNARELRELLEMINARAAERAVARHGGRVDWDRATAVGWRLRGDMVERRRGDGVLERVHISTFAETYPLTRGRAPQQPVASKQQRRAATRRLAPLAERAPVEREIPELRARASAAPKVTVDLAPAARQTIKEELFATRELLRDGYETGGWLFAIRFSNPVDVCRATGMGRDGWHGPSQCMLGREAREDALAEIARYGLNEVVVGRWHVHPGGRADNAPSPTDRASALDLAGQGGRWIDLILTEDERGDWFRPRVHGWVTHRPHGVTAITEPATVTAVTL